MCGIFALFLKRPLDDVDIALGRTGTAALHHRGPDATGEWFDRSAGAYLGNTRLAIIDLSEAAALPMAGDGMALAYNGEIYNHRELRADLAAAGARFRSTGDTAVLLEAWRRWQHAALNRLDGMFAFALWDGRSAHLAVDAFAEKPLYIAETADGVYVSSEIGPLARLLDLRPDISDERLIEAVALGYFPAPATAYPAIRKLPAASTIEIRNGRPGRIARYWHPPLGEPGRGRVQPLGEAQLDRLQAALVDSLRGRLIADVPMCVFLSAGVDSSLVAAMTKRDLAADVECMTVSFGGADTADESRPAAETARYLGLAHRVVPSVDAADGNDAVRVLDIYGQPCDAVTTLAIHQMTAAVSSDYKVGLTGSGGDEVSFGYGKHDHFYRFHGLYNLPERARLALGAVARAVPASARRLDRLARDIGVHDYERYIAQRTYPAIDWLRRLPGFEAWARRYYGGDARRIELAVPAREIADVMPNSRLMSMDLGSMRASVELRTPFLSRRVVETMASFDPRAAMAFGQKSLLRRLLRRYLPVSLVDRPKRGFVYPHDRLLQPYNGQPPNVPGLDPGAVREVWSRLSERRGWLRLAVRLALLHTFATTEPYRLHQPACSASIPRP